MMAATERTTSLSRHSSSLSLSASPPRAQKKSGQLTLQSPPPPLPTLPPLFFHILPLLALHSRTPGLMYAFGLTYTLPLLPSFLQKMMMNCWMQHRTSTCLFPPQLAALSLIWNKLLMTCTLPPLNRYLLIPFLSRPFQSAPHIPMAYPHH